MLRKINKARFGQIVLLLASLLAVAGSVGLHPEPASAPAAFAGETAPAWHGPQLSDGGTHDCLACLAHRSIPLPTSADIVLRPVAAVARVTAPSSQRPRAAQPRTHEGRAPPALA